MQTKSMSLSFPGMRARIIPDGDGTKAFESEGTASVAFEKGFEFRLLGIDAGIPETQSGGGTG